MEMNLRYRLPLGATSLRISSCPAAVLQCHNHQEWHVTKPSSKTVYDVGCLGPSATHESFVRILKVQILSTARAPAESSFDATLCTDTPLPDGHPEFFELCSRYALIECRRFAPPHPRFPGFSDVGFSESGAVMHAHMDVAQISPPPVLCVLMRTNHQRQKWSSRSLYYVKAVLHILHPQSQWGRALDIFYSRLLISLQPSTSMVGSIRCFRPMPTLDSGHIAPKRQRCPDTVCNPSRGLFICLQPTSAFLHTRRAGSQDDEDCFVGFM